MSSGGSLEALAPSPLTSKVGRELPDLISLIFREHNGWLDVANLTRIHCWRRIGTTSNLSFLELEGVYGRSSLLNPTPPPPNTTPKPELPGDGGRLRPQWVSRL